MTTASDRTSGQNLTRAIALGGIATVTFLTLVIFAWYYHATLFLIFSGVLLGVALHAVTNLLGKVWQAPAALRLTIVCVVLVGLMSGVVFLGGATIAQQATVLSTTIKGQLSNVKGFLDQHGVDTSFLDFNSAPATAAAAATDDSNPSQSTAPATSKPSLPNAGTLASSGSAIVGQTFKILLGTLSAVGNIFIVLFLGLTFAAQPSVYRKGLLSLAPVKYRGQVTTVVDRITETLERWLLAQIVTMTAVFLVTWIGLTIIGIDSAFILGVQAGLLTFIPTIGALIGGAIVVLASLASGWVAAASAFALFLGVHALESYILTPLIQRQALDIPPATLFAFQILLGVVFGLWGLALALPLLAIVKVIIDFSREEHSAESAEAA